MNHLLASLHSTHGFISPGSDLILHRDFPQPAVHLAQGSPARQSDEQTVHTAATNMDATLPMKVATVRMGEG